MDTYVDVWLFSYFQSLPIRVCWPHQFKTLASNVTVIDSFPSLLKH